MKIIFPISYENLCLNISFLLNKNKNLWREFGPNSFFDSEKDPIKQDLNLWENVKNNEILPNNKKIRELIENNESIIPEQDTNVFNLMKNHLIAFEAHVKNSSISYNEFQFPSSFETLIYEKCKSINLKEQNKILIWIRKELLSQEYFQIEELWIYGSILKTNYNSISDTDIIILDNCCKKDIIKQNAICLENIKKKFKNRFNKKIHISYFSGLEKESFFDFLKNIDLKRKG